MLSRILTAGGSQNRPAYRIEKKMRYWQYTVNNIVRMYFKVDSFGAKLEEVYNISTALITNRKNIFTLVATSQGSWSHQCQLRMSNRAGQ